MPNAVVTFKEYLLDYASEKTKKVGEKLIEKEINSMTGEMKKMVIEMLGKIENGKRDIYI